MTKPEVIRLAHEINPVYYPYKRENPTFCPFCSFRMERDLERHFLNCLIRRSVETWFTPSKES